MLLNSYFFIMRLVSFYHFTLHFVVHLNYLTTGLVTLRPKRDRDVYDVALGLPSSRLNLHPSKTPTICIKLYISINEFGRLVLYVMTLVHFF